MVHRNSYVNVALTSAEMAALAKLADNARLSPTATLREILRLVSEPAPSAALALTDADDALLGGLRRLMGDGMRMQMTQSGVDPTFGLSLDGVFTEYLNFLDAQAGDAGLPDRGGLPSAYYFATHPVTGRKIVCHMSNRIVARDGAFVVESVHTSSDTVWREQYASWLFARDAAMRAVTPPEDEQ